MAIKSHNMANNSQRLADMEVLVQLPGKIYHSHDWMFCPAAFNRNECWCDLLHGAQWQPEGSNK